MQAWQAEWEWVDVVRGGQRERHPLGSVRSSLGWLSRFEDAYALWTFIQKTYTDRWDNSTAAATSGISAGGGLWAAEGYARRHVAAVQSSSC